ncbi:hypothetical protein LNP05_14540 [Klebsiella pneumoniae subsp. pneumoniae]|nr:hypothetical protein [Klebsiella pneumoniae subsp. pneumoniae]
MNDPDFNLLAAPRSAAGQYRGDYGFAGVASASGAGPGHRWLRQRVREVCRE